MRVLVTGASSSPGYRTVLELSSEGYIVYAVYNTHRPVIDQDNVKLVRIDIRDTGKLASILQDLKPDIIVHMAALGDVDLCEKEQERAWKVNVIATRIIAKYAAKNNIYLVYLSTDYVFDGARGLYREEDTPHPINYYGLTKLVAEEAVTAATEKSLVVRTSAIYGLGMGRKNFGKFLIETLCNGKEVKALIDQWLSPTLNTLLARAIKELIERRIYGLLHVAGERVSRYEFAIKLAKKFGFDANLVKPAYMKDFSWIAPRPRDSSLNVERAKNLIPIKFYSLDYALDILLDEWRKKRHECA